MGALCPDYSHFEKDYDMVSRVKIVINVKHANDKKRPLPDMSSNGRVFLT